MFDGLSGHMLRFLPRARPISSARPTLSPEIVKSGQTSWDFFCPNYCLLLCKAVYLKKY